MVADDESDSDSSSSSDRLSPMTYQASGVITRISSTQLEITELPVG